MRPQHIDRGDRPFDAVTGSLRTWLAGGVRSISVDVRRQRGTHRGLKQVLTHDQPDITASQPWGDFPRVLERQVVREAINSLRPEHRRVVTLAYFGGFTNRQIARVMGVSQSTVRRRLRVALEHMLDYIDRSRGGWAGSMVAWTVRRTLGVRGPASMPSLGELAVAGTAATVIAASAVLVLAGPGSASGHQPSKHRAAAVRVAPTAAATHAGAPLSVGTGAVSSIRESASLEARPRSAPGRATEEGSSISGLTLPALPAVSTAPVPGLPATVTVPGAIGSAVNGAAGKVVPAPALPTPSPRPHLVLQNVLIG